jgi:hypothetical protein
MFSLEIIKALNNKSLEKFNVIITMRILSPDQDSDGFFIFLDKNADYPEVFLLKSNDIDTTIYQTLIRFFSEDTAAFMCQNKHLSGIAKDKDKIFIQYNMFVSNKCMCKSGQFVKFDKRNIELYRYLNNIK